MSDLEKAMAGDKEAFSRIIIQNKESMYKKQFLFLKMEMMQFIHYKKQLLKSTAN